MAGGRSKAESFLRHLEPLKGALEAYCRRSLRDPADVGDVLQSAVANAYRDFHLYAEGTNFRAWVFRYVHGEVCNANRRSLRSPSPLGSIAEPHAGSTPQPTFDGPLAEALRDDPDAVLDQCEQELAEAVRELPPQERAVLLLRAVGEFRYREIAEVLGIPLGTVMSSLSRGRLRLRQRLAALGTERGLFESGEADLG